MIALVFMSGAIFLEENKMQNNVAKLVRGIAIALFVLGIAGSILIAVPYLEKTMTRIYGVEVIAVGIFGSLVAFALILGFSELIEKTDESSRYQKEIWRIASNFEIKGVPSYKVDPDLTNSSAIQEQNNRALSQLQNVRQSSNYITQ